MAKVPKSDHVQLPDVKENVEGSLHLIFEKPNSYTFINPLLKNVMTTGEKTLVLGKDPYGMLKAFPLHFENAGPEERIKKRTVVIFGVQESNFIKGLRKKCHLYMRIEKKDLKDHDENIFDLLELADSVNGEKF